MRKKAVPLETVQSAVLTLPEPAQERARENLVLLRVMLGLPVSVSKPLDKGIGR